MSSLSQKASKHTAHSRKMLDPGVVVVVVVVDDIVAGCGGVVGSSESIMNSSSLSSLSSSPCGIVVVEIETMLSKGGSTDEASGSATSFWLAIDSLNFWKSNEVSE